MINILIVFLIFYIIPVIVAYISIRCYYKMPCVGEPTAVDILIMLLPVGNYIVPIVMFGLIAQDKGWIRKLFGYRK